MSRPRLLDLFCGAGGAAVGYYRAGFDVVGVDIKPQPHYPFEFFQMNALFALGTGMADGFDVIHASPPCQAYGSLAALNESRGYKSKHEKLIEPVRDLLEQSGLPYVIENVEGAPLRGTVKLCGSMFGLRVRRHRPFETSFAMLQPHCQHDLDFVGVYGDHPEAGTVGCDGYTRQPRAKTINEARTAMGIDWMDWHEITQAMPPAYTEFIGEQLMSRAATDPPVIAKPKEDA